MTEYLFDQSPKTGMEPFGQVVLLAQTNPGHDKEGALDELMASTDLPLGIIFTIPTRERGYAKPC